MCHIAIGRREIVLAMHIKNPRETGIQVSRGFFMCINIVLSHNHFHRLTVGIFNNVKPFLR